MSIEKVLDIILKGTSDKNIKFQDLRKLLIMYGFSELIRGDHFIFSKENIFELINLQPLKDGNAKQYQVKQVRNLFLKYKFHAKED
jgi:hypothetical protein